MSFDNKNIAGAMFLREVGQEQAFFASRRREEKFELIYPSQYFRLKYYSHTDSTLEGVVKRLEFYDREIFSKYLLKNLQKKLFLFITSNDVKKIRDNIDRFPLNALLVSDEFWTEANPLSPYRGISDEMRLLLWNFVVSKSPDDILGLLHWAIRLHLSAQQISALLEQFTKKGIDIDALHDDAKTEFGGMDNDTVHWTLLEKACQFNQVETVRLLLAKTPKVNRWRTCVYFTPPIEIACHYGNAELAELLLQYPGHPNPEIDQTEYTIDLHTDFGENFPLGYAAMRGNLLLANLLLQNDANIDCATVDQSNDEEMPKTALAHAAEHGQAGMVEFLLHRGAQVNAGMMCPLYEASRHGHLGVVKILVGRMKLEKFSEDGYEYSTYLEAAYHAKKFDVARFLLEKSLELTDANDEDVKRYWKKLNSIYSDVILPLCEDNPELLTKFLSHSFSEIPSSGTEYEFEGKKRLRDEGDDQKRDDATNASVRKQSKLMLLGTSEEQSRHDGNSDAFFSQKTSISKESLRKP